MSEGSTPSVQWRTTNTAVVGIENTGFVISTGNGTALIIASAQDAADTLTAVVDQVPVSLNFALEPGHAAVGDPFLVPTTVFIADSNGFPVGNVTESVTIELATNPGGATLGGVTTKPFNRGVAEFTDLTVSDAGNGYTLRAVTSQFSTTTMPFNVLASPDLVRFHNTADQPVGVLLDGHSSLFINDFKQITEDSSVTTVLGPGAPSGEIVAFTEGRPPSVATAPVWTDGVDTVDVTFRDVLHIPVTAWIVAGPFTDLRNRAADQAATTTLYWAAERMGLEFSEFEIVDATADPDASRLQTTTQCNQQALARSAIGERAGRINVYYVGVVDGGRDRGYSCGSVIFMADRSGHELLIHEIGHSFGLGHVDNLTGYNQTNIMHSASNVREFLTEGQVFRSHFNSFSALNDLYGFRPAGLRSCFDSSFTERCLSLINRIWADGAFPPN